jgi:hypothetical protein
MCQYFVLAQNAHNERSLMYHAMAKTVNFQLYAQLKAQGQFLAIKEIQIDAFRLGI